MSDSLDLFSLDQFRYVAGVDEVGRGCLAGPVVAAAVILALALYAGAEFPGRAEDYARLRQKQP